MTVQLRSSRVGKSKKVLEEALNGEKNWQVYFEDPSIVRSFTGADIKEGERFACVLDPDTRRRFATVERKPGGRFKVS